jgi:hypothetical protein
MYKRYICSISVHNTVQYESSFPSLSFKHKRKGTDKNKQNKARARTVRHTYMSL